MADVAKPQLFLDDVIEIDGILVFIACLFNDVFFQLPTALPNTKAISSPKTN
jgi:hypothetical protein